MFALSSAPVRVVVQKRAARRRTVDDLSTRARPTHAFVRARCVVRAQSKETSSTATISFARAERSKCERRAMIKTLAQSGGYGRGGFNIVPVPDRVVALVPYILPLLSALRYSRFFFNQFPAAIVLLKPLMPILRMVSTLPMGNLILFFSVYLGVAKNQNLSRFCRFNGMQAILLDIALIFPSLVETLFGPGILGIGLPPVLTMLMHNAIFVVTLGAFALAAVGCMTGKYVRLPVLADAAEAQMGY